MMKEIEARSLFNLAGIDVLAVEPLIDGYNFRPDDPRFFETTPRQVWWFVKTCAGWIKIGWRKRVINIDWTDTPVRVLLNNEQTTMSECLIHAWSTEDALRYLKQLKPHLQPTPPAGSLDPIEQLIQAHAELIADGNHYAYFELAYTRQTAWMAWLCDKPREMNPDRKVLAKGQGGNPQQACANALKNYVKPD